jgi:predicted GH43/DUF377 family glycosyl hydrolase
MSHRKLLNVLTLLAVLCSGWIDVATAADKPHPFDLRPQPWQRRDEPILSARTTKQAWCRVVCYSPHVIYHAGRFRMWYLGTSLASRSNDIVMGYAESKDGLQWTEHKQNPILTGGDIPWGRIVQTPFVLFDTDEKLYKMWFVSGAGIGRDNAGKVVSNDQRLGYATSSDGISWKVRAEPIYVSGRSPSVIKEGPNRYRMWMGSSASRESAWNDIYTTIYEFTSTDGIDWNRSEQPVLTPREPARSTVYPFVLKRGDGYDMWHGCHVPGGRFELFCARSTDGSRWWVDHTKPAFSATGGKTDFDGRYTSTPCVVERPDRYLLYYSARDLQNEYIDGQGRKRKDGAGVYAHIGVAVIMKVSSK